MNRFSVSDISYTVPISNTGGFTSADGSFYTNVQLAAKALAHRKARQDELEQGDYNNTDMIAAVDFSQRLTNDLLSAGAYGLMYYGPGLGDPPDLIPFGGVMFYTENGDLLYSSGKGNRIIIYSISSKNVETLLNAINAYKKYWSQKRPCINCDNEYNNPDFFQNLANKYGLNSYSVIAGYGYTGNPYVFGYINAPWYMYAAATATFAGEGFAAGYNSGRAYNQYGRWGYEGFSNHYNTSLNYGIQNTWSNYFGLKKFEPWW